MNYQFDFAPVIEGLPDLLWGCVGTLGLALSGMALALVIGIGGVMLRDSRIPALRWLVISFVEVIRNTPFLGQIYFIFFALPLPGVRLNPTVTAIIALGVNGGAYAIEIIRGGRAVDQQGTDRSGLRAWPEPDAGIPSDRAEAGAAGDFSLAHQPVHPADADDEHRVGDIGL